MRIDTVSSNFSPAIRAPQAETSPRVAATDQTPDIAPENQATAVEPEKNPDELQQPMITDKMLDKAVEQANKSLSTFDRVIERSIHEKTHTVMYVIRDAKTNEVIGEFPPKKIQDMIAKMWELAGLFVDEKA